MEKNIEEVFEKHYEAADSEWGNSSGPGSHPFHTVDYRSFLSKFISLNLISRIVDVGCGDWQFSKFVDFGSASYIGFDVVDKIVKRNIDKYTSEKISFDLMPRNMGDIPGGDLLLMKDVLQHLSNEMIFKFQEIVFPKFKYCILTNSFAKLNTPQNIDIVTGSFRCLDLKNEPYNFAGAYLMEYGSAVWERVRVFLYDERSS